MTLLITGGSGFIGRNLVEYFSARREVLAPTHGELELLDEDAVARYFREHPVDVVIHSAVTPGHRNAKDLRNLLYRNTRMFFNLVRNGDRFRRMIFLGSGAVYDTRRPLCRVREDDFDARVPEDEHGFSKYICARHVERAGNIVELRLFGVFGKYEDYAIRFISNAVCKALFDLPITLRQDRVFSYLWIDDLLPVLDHFIANPGRHVAYNVTPDGTLELARIAELVREICGKDVEIRIGRPGMGPEYTGDNRRLRDEIPGLSFTDIRTAVGRLRDYYSSCRGRIDRESLLFDK